MHRVESTAVLLRAYLLPLREHIGSPSEEETDALILPLPVDSSLIVLLLHLDKYGRPMIAYLYYWLLSVLEMIECSLTYVSLGLPYLADH